TIAILGACATQAAKAKRARVNLGGLERAYELLARFAPYEAFPGKAIRLLGRVIGSARYEKNDPVPEHGPREVTRAFVRETGLPESILSDEVILDPDEVLDFFKARVIAQARASELVTAAVARLKAGIADPRRPLGSFLFIGPTGVGKTETAKALAE